MWSLLLLTVGFLMIIDFFWSNPDPSNSTDMLLLWSSSLGHDSHSHSHHLLANNDKSNPTTIKKETISIKHLHAHPQSRRSLYLLLPGRAVLLCLLFLLSVLHGHQASWDNLASCRCRLSLCWFYWFYYFSYYFQQLPLVHVQTKIQPSPKANLCHHLQPARSRPFPILTLQGIHRPWRSGCFHDHFVGRVAWGLGENVG